MPHAGLQMASLDTLAASDGLATGAVDAVIGPAPMYPPKPGIYRENLYEDEAALLVNKTYRAPKRARLSPAQFNALRYVDTWLVLGERSAGHRVAEEFLERHGLKRKFALVAPNFFTAAMVVASSDLASVMPRRLAERFTTILPLKILSIPAPALRFQQQLIWHERAHRDHGTYTPRDGQGARGGMGTEELLSKIAAPVLILKADAPPETRKANEEAAKVIQHGKLVHVDGAAHNLHHDQRKTTVDELNIFLKTL
jgi:pimeloyl-ACP methyl ester carboxylesterase